MSFLLLFSSTSGGSASTWGTLRREHPPGSPAGLELFFKRDDPPFWVLMVDERMLNSAR